MRTYTYGINFLYNRGHNVRIVTYGDIDDPVDVCLECENWEEVLIDAELYTLCARKNGAPCSG